MLCDDPLVCADTLPIISRPSVEVFLSYAKEDRKAEVADVLRRYPELVDVEDEVSV